MTAVDSAMRMDWNSWLRGVIGALVSGGAAAIGGSVAIPAFDPSHDIVGIHLFALLGSLFLFSGMVSMFKFLQTHPLPDPVAQEVVANVKTTTTITPVDTSQPATTIASSTPVTGPSLPPEVKK